MKLRIKSFTKKNFLEFYLPIFIYASIIGIIFYLYLTLPLSGEDLYQRSQSISQRSAGGIMGVIDYVYHYIARLGEFWQRLAALKIDYATGFLPALLLRGFIATIVVAIPALGTAAILRRRPKITLHDASIFGLIFVALFGTMFRDPLVFGFSHVHNYAIAMFFALIFLLLMQKQKYSKPWLVFLFFASIAFALSTELLPFVYLISLVAVLIYKKIKKQKIHPTAKIIIATIGVLIGMAIYYSGSNISHRIDGGYGEVYGYLSPFAIFTSPLTAIPSFAWHIIYNMRFLAFPLILAIITAIKIYFVRPTRKSDLPDKSTNLMLVGTALLYVLGNTPIMVHDDLYARMMMAPFLALVLYFLNISKHITKKHSLAICISLALYIIVLALYLANANALTYGGGIKYW
ncbi:MAG: hypothetical protein ACK5MU_01820 [Candidatus Saccharimonadales bacterium]